ncbi:ABC transporter permease [Mycolicibacterium porcinum]|uniref:ABC transporter permease n=1 Tax=Mycolicibacterium porcinum TaxID=39693 RepID=A0AAW5T397_9MYCO|nr:ABC transporter permease [Mycolicibacterium porcinum]MBX8687713.1 ABC transporter permease subunit [Mycobacterium sp. 20091114027_K0903767]OCB45285.1 ABC transporter permease [Mycolicibacterium vulneris]MCV7389900.1 ABC transporter permease [Mycolicibacterium porcinum]ORB38266.1 ABC transporter permease [Mycolicibacterium porcinum]TVY00789.1 ABC transporter permease [Mycolicibacterium porcinum]
MTTSYVAQDDLPTEDMSTHAGRPEPERRKMRVGNSVISMLSTLALIIGFLLFAELGARTGLWSDRILPAPSVILSELGRLLGEGQFWNDAARTGIEVAFSILFGSLLGFAAGLTFWKLPAVGRIFEPYLVSFYAVPLVLFYPVMIVIVGINATSVIILATIMAAIPMALNTAVGLNTMPPVYMKLARSLKASPRQTLFAIAIPAAGPYIVAGLRLAVVYALIGTIAMEFTTAQAGLGYRIRYLYEIFNNNEMFAYIAVVLVLSCILTALLAGVERILLRGRNR